MAYIWVSRSKKKENQKIANKHAERRNRNLDLDLKLLNKSSETLDNQPYEWYKLLEVKGKGQSISPSLPKIVSNHLNFLEIKTTELKVWLIWIRFQRNKVENFMDSIYDSELVARKIFKKHINVNQDLWFPTEDAKSAIHLLDQDENLYDEIKISPPLIKVHSKKTVISLFV